MKALLAGNPNSGKTTLFNLLTGAKAQVGNFPGVTVEHLTGALDIKGKKLELIDLPGIYSLNPDTLEQKVCRDYIVSSKPDFIINILDATNIERNLFLTLQLKEYKIPMIIVLNMIDEVEKLGTKIDAHMLSSMLDAPVIEISASKGTGKGGLLKLISHFFSDSGQLTHADHDDLVETELENCDLSNCDGCSNKACHKRQEPRKKHSKKGSSWKKVFEIRHFRLHKRAHWKMRAAIEKTNDAETIEHIKQSEKRYELIEHIVFHCVTRQIRASKGLTSAIDKIVLNRFLAVPMFLLIMLVMFSITFGSFVTFLSEKLDVIINKSLVELLQGGMISANIPNPIISLVCNGIVAGVGAVICFLPQIFILFLILSVLEDSGYLSRAAFICDRIFARFGLSGKAFVPLIMGFGCAVPAVMSCRIMKNERERRLTIMLTPFISCSAKLPVYALLAGVFFKGYEGIITLGLYLTGIVVAFFTALIFSKAVLKDNQSTFIMEMPPYRFPTLRNLWIHTFQRVWGFIQKAGTVLLAVSVAVWFAQSFTTSFVITDDPSQSILAYFGRLIAPVFEPLGFGNWYSATAVIIGASAKELIVSTFSVLSGDAGAATLIGDLFTPLSAISFLVFSLLYMPCLSTIVVMKKELSSLKYLFITLTYAFAIAYGICFVIYNAGSFLMRS